MILGKSLLRPISSSSSSPHEVSSSDVMMTWNKSKTIDLSALQEDRQELGKNAMRREGQRKEEESFFAGRRIDHRIIPVKTTKQSPLDTNKDKTIDKLGDSSHESDNKKRGSEIEIDSKRQTSQADLISTSNKSVRTTKTEQKRSHMVNSKTSSDRNNPTQEHVMGPKASSRPLKLRPAKSEHTLASAKWLAEEKLKKKKEADDLLARKQMARQLDEERRSKMKQSRLKKAYIEELNVKEEETDETPQDGKNSHRRHEFHLSKENMPPKTDEENYNSKEFAPASGTNVVDRPSFKTSGHFTHSLDDDLFVPLSHRPFVPRLSKVIVRSGTNSKLDTAPKDHKREDDDSEEYSDNEEFEASNKQGRAPVDLKFDEDSIPSPGVLITVRPKYESDNSFSYDLHKEAFDYSDKPITSDSSSGPNLNPNQVIDNAAGDKYSEYSSDESEIETNKKEAKEIKDDSNLSLRQRKREEAREYLKKQQAQYEMQQRKRRREVEAKKLAISKRLQVLQQKSLDAVKSAKKRQHAPVAPSRTSTEPRRKKQAGEMQVEESRIENQNHSEGILMQQDGDDSSARVEASATTFETLVEGAMSFSPSRVETSEAVDDDVDIGIENALSAALLGDTRGTVEPCGDKNDAFAMLEDTNDFSSKHHNKNTSTNVAVSRATKKRKQPRGVSDARHKQWSDRNSRPSYAKNAKPGARHMASTTSSVMRHQKLDNKTPQKFAARDNKRKPRKAPKLGHKKSKPDKMPANKSGLQDFGMKSSVIDLLKEVDHDPFENYGKQDVASVQASVSSGLALTELINDQCSATDSLTGNGQQSLSTTSHIADVHGNKWNESQASDIIKQCLTSSPAKKIQTEVERMQELLNAMTETLESRTNVTSSVSVGASQDDILDLRLSIASKLYPIKDDDFELNSSVEKKDVETRPSGDASRSSDSFSESPPSPPKDEYDAQSTAKESIEEHRFSSEFPRDNNIAVSDIADVTDDPYLDCKMKLLQDKMDILSKYSEQAILVNTSEEELIWGDSTHALRNVEGVDVLVSRNGVSSNEQRLDESSKLLMHPHTNEARLESTSRYMSSDVLHSMKHNEWKRDDSSLASSSSSESDEHGIVSLFAKEILLQREQEAEDKATAEVLQRKSEFAAGIAARFQEHPPSSFTPSKSDQEVDDRSMSPRTYWDQLIAKSPLPHAHMAPLGEEDTAELKDTLKSASQDALSDEKDGEIPTVTKVTSSEDNPNVTSTTSLASASTTRSNDHRLTGAELRLLMNEELRRQEDIYRVSLELAEAQQANTVETATTAMKEIVAKAQEEANGMESRMKLLQMQQAYEMSLASTTAEVKLASQLELAQRDALVASLENKLSEQAEQSEQLEYMRQTVDNVSFAAQVMDLKSNVVNQQMAASKVEREKAIESATQTSFQSNTIEDDNVNINVNQKPAEKMPRRDSRGQDQSKSKSFDDNEEESYAADFTQESVEYSVSSGARSHEPVEVKGANQSAEQVEEESYATDYYGDDSFAPSQVSSLMKTTSPSKGRDFSLSTSMFEVEEESSYLTQQKEDDSLILSVASSPASKRKVSKDKSFHDGVEEVEEDSYATEYADESFVQSVNTSASASRLRPPVPINRDVHAHRRHGVEESLLEVEEEHEDSYASEAYDDSFVQSVSDQNVSDLKDPVTVEGDVNRHPLSTSTAYKPRPSPQKSKLPESKDLDRDVEKCLHELESRLRSQHEALDLRLQLERRSKDRQIQLLSQKRLSADTVDFAKREIELQFAEACSEIESERWAVSASYHKERRRYELLRHQLALSGLPVSGSAKPLEKFKTVKKQIKISPEKEPQSVSKHESSHSLEEVHDDEVDTVEDSDDYLQSNSHIYQSSFEEDHDESYSSEVFEGLSTHHAPEMVEIAKASRLDNDQIVTSHIPTEQELKTREAALQARRLEANRLLEAKQKELSRLKALARLEKEEKEVEMLFENASRMDIDKELEKQRKLIERIAKSDVDTTTKYTKASSPKPINVNKSVGGRKRAPSSGSGGSQSYEEDFIEEGSVEEVADVATVSDGTDEVESDDSVQYDDEYEEEFDEVEDELTKEVSRDASSSGGSIEDDERFDKRNASVDEYSNTFHAASDASMHHSYTLEFDNSMQSPSKAAMSTSNVKESSLDISADEVPAMTSTDTFLELDASLDARRGRIEVLKGKILALKREKKMDRLREKEAERERLRAEEADLANYLNREEEAYNKEKERVMRARLEASHDKGVDDLIATLGKDTSLDEDSSTQLLNEHQVLQEEDEAAEDSFCSSSSLPSPRQTSGNQLSYEVKHRVRRLEAVEVIQRVVRGWLGRLKAKRRREFEVCVASQASKMTVEGDVRREFRDAEAAEDIADEDSFNSDFSTSTQDDDDEDVKYSEEEKLLGMEMTLKHMKEVAARRDDLTNTIDTSEDMHKSDDMENDQSPPQDVDSDVTDADTRRIEDHDNDDDVQSASHGSVDDVLIAPLDNDRDIVSSEVIEVDEPDSFADGNNSTIPSQYEGDDLSAVDYQDESQSLLQSLSPALTSGDSKKYRPDEDGGDDSKGDTVAWGRPIVMKDQHPVANARDNTPRDDTDGGTDDLHALPTKSLAVDDSQDVSSILSSSFSSGEDVKDGSYISVGDDDGVVGNSSVVVDEKEHENDAENDEVVQKTSEMAERLRHDDNDKLQADAMTPSFTDSAADEMEEIEEVEEDIDEPLQDSSSLEAQSEISGSGDRESNDDGLKSPRQDISQPSLVADDELEEQSALFEESVEELHRMESKEFDVVEPIHAKPNALKAAIGSLQDDSKKELQFVGDLTEALWKRLLASHELSNAVETVDKIDESSEEKEKLIDDCNSETLQPDRVIEKADEEDKTKEAEDLNQLQDSSLDDVEEVDDEYEELFESDEEKALVCDDATDKDGEDIDRGGDKDGNEDSYSSEEFEELEEEKPSLESAFPPVSSSPFPSLLPARKQPETDPDEAEEEESEGDGKQELYDLLGDEPSEPDRFTRRGFPKERRSTDAFVAPLSPVEFGNHPVQLQSLWDSKGLAYLEDLFSRLEEKEGSDAGPMWSEVIDNLNNPAFDSQDGVINEDVFFEMELNRDPNFEDPDGITLEAIQMNNKIVFDRVNEALAALHRYRHRTAASTISLSKQMIAQSLPLTPASIATYIRREMSTMKHREPIRQSLEDGSVEVTWPNALDMVHVPVLDSVQERLDEECQCLLEEVTEGIWKRLLLEVAAGIQRANS